MNCCMMLVNVDWDCVLCFMILLVCDCDYSQAKLQKVMRNFKIPLVHFRPNSEFPTKGVRFVCFSEFLYRGYNNVA